jgi:ethanolamine ammonia-lyase small subunit
MAANLLTPDPWNKLQRATAARIALGRAGGSLPMRAWLDFKLAHAAARDAVHCPFDAEKVASDIRSLGVEVIVVDSAAGDRMTFLQRPDLGRRLDDRSRFALQECSPHAPREGVLHAGFDRELDSTELAEVSRTEREDYTDLAIVVSDGLSALAVHRHAPTVLAALLPRLQTDAWRVAPVVVARFGRVALQDEVGQVLGAQLALMLIGERPGLGSPDSLGAYLVYCPRPGNTDANRNCVSNVRPEGLPCEVAAQTLHYLLTESRRRKLSGVALKDERTIHEAAPVRELGSKE